MKLASLKLRPNTTQPPARITAPTMSTAHQGTKAPSRPAAKAMIKSSSEAAHVAPVFTWPVWKTWLYVAVPDINVPLSRVMSNPTPRARTVLLNTCSGGKKIKVIRPKTRINGTAKRRYTVRMASQ